jgi:2-methylcitrate dehydratase PrpD
MANRKPDTRRVSRRRALQSAGGFIAAATIPSSEAVIDASSSQTSPRTSSFDVTGRLARYMVQARELPLSSEVAREARHRIVDTMAAMVSGARLKPGEMAIKYLRTQGGSREACVLTTDIMTTAVNAALANGMFGHADETDDFEPVTKAHPGCAVVPAALAMGERDGRSGLEFLRAVVLGYDVCCRFLMALGPDHVRASHRSAEGPSSTMGAAAAAASMARLDEAGMRYTLAYAAQQVSGIWSWVRDEEHVEKAFDFGGMGARNGVASATMVQTGFTGVWDVLDGEHNLIDAYSTEPRPEEMVAGLGVRFYVRETAIKTFSVGYPIQSPLDALLKLRREHDLTPDNVDSVVARLPEDGAKIVNNRSMPDVNLQHIMAVALIDGTVSFADSHSYERMKDPQVLAVKERIRLVPDPALVVPDAPRSGFVEVMLRDGRKVSHFTRHAPGTKENPLDAEGVNAKARDLMTPVLGRERTEALIRQLHAIEDLDDVRKLRALVTS